MPKLTDEWFKSSHSAQGGTCVETRFSGDTVEVRDTKDNGQGPILAFSAKAWAEFLPVALEH